ncbi:MAG: hypothetical protein AAF616_01445 [Bacteroidota bacterium]
MRITLGILYVVFFYCLNAQVHCGHKSSFENLEFSNLFSEIPDTLGFIKQKEISGIAPSIRYPGYFWAVNDSGNGAVLYLFSLEDASLKSLFILKGISNIDWEDLAILKKDGNIGTLYIADFGDNQAKRKLCTIYKMDEPELAGTSSKIQKITVTPEQITYRYENGPRDAESLAIDPLSGLLYILTKREEHIYMFPLDPRFDSTQVIEAIGTLPLNNVVAADFSLDGMKLMVKTYTDIYLFERKSQSTSVCEMLSGVPKKIPYLVEPQGESVCFVEGGFITVSEERFKIEPKLYFYTISQND